MTLKNVQLTTVKVAVFACLALAVSARGPGGYGGGGGSYGDHSGGSYGPGTEVGEGEGWNNNEGNGGTGGAADFNRGGGPALPFDMAATIHYRYIHGTLAAVAMAILFPIGSILLRVLPGRIGVWVHAVFQVLALCVYISAAGLGIYLVKTVQIPGLGSLLSRPSKNYHPIIGLTLLVMFLLQPIIGFIHHLRFKKVQKRQVWSYLHLFNGRVGVTLGMVNGGLGLNLADASTQRKKVYTIVAAVMWSLWMITGIFSEIRRIRSRRVKKTEEKVMTRVSTTERRGSED